MSRPAVLVLTTILVTSRLPASALRVTGARSAGITLSGNDLDRAARIVDGQARVQ